jgi:oligo-1,6-glucosidase
MADAPDTPPAPQWPEGWWRDAVVYQIYPRSFMDSNGDGVGDLNGITSRLDHLQQLGVDVVWLSPHFDSPNADNGYDIRDYRRVMSEFGTMDDFDRMLAAMTERGIRLIIDLVVNHTSDEHEWFERSRSSRDDLYRDFYVWRDGRIGDDGSAMPPNNYPSFFSGSAWQYDEATGQYYLHYFAVKQPDLNWEHEPVRREVYDLMRFWLDKGVAGFRMDVIPFISKQPGLPDLVGDERMRPQYVYASGPRLHEFLQEMHREALAPYGDPMTVGEAFGVEVAEIPQFTDPARHELSMIFQFDLVRLGHPDWRHEPFTWQQFKQIVGELDATAGEHGWNTSFLGNHDNPRVVSQFGDDRPEWRERSAKAMATFVLTQRATPFIYQGDELGMTNFPFTSFDQYEDVAVRGLWRTLVETGRVPAGEMLEHLARTSRDHSRTPVQWSDGPQAGFTTGTPWLAVNPNHVEINAAAQVADPGSVFHHHRRLIALRREHPVLVHGDYLDVDPDHPYVFAYTRTLRDVAALVVLHLGTETHRYALPDGLSIASTLLACGSTPEPGATSLILDGWHSSVHLLAGT